MKAKDRLSYKTNHRGEYKLTDDRTGAVYYSNDMRIQDDGMVVHKKNYDEFTKPRQPYYMPPYPAKPFGDAGYDPYGYELVADALTSPSDFIPITWNQETFSWDVSGNWEEELYL